MALAKKDDQTQIVLDAVKDQKTITEDATVKVVGENGPETLINQDEHPAATPTVVKMVRETPMHAGGPVTADVHEDEVAGWLKAGWNKA